MSNRMILDNEYRWWLAAATLILQLLGATLPMCQSFVSISHHFHHHHHTLIHQQLLATSNDNEDNSSLDVTSLNKRIKQQQSQYVNLILEQSKYTEHERVVPASIHIILFNPNTPQQHAHTIEFPKGSGTNLILAFESGSDCAGFARMLQDLEFVDPSVSTSRYLSTIIRLRCYI